MSNKDKCSHKWVKWEVKEDDVCENCGMCASEYVLVMSSDKTSDKEGKQC